jgi:hypothetical protein
MSSNNSISEVCVSSIVQITANNYVDRQKFICVIFLSSYEPQANSQIHYDDRLQVYTIIHPHFLYVNNYKCL